MLEIEDCRKCAVCCHNCIFLHLDKKEKLYSCLIYRNKNRFPISSDLLRFSESSDKERVKLHYSHFLNYIESIVTGKRPVYTTYRIGVCDRWICYTLEHYKRVREDVSKLESASLNNRFIYEEYRNEMRKLVPDFDDLIEILNG